MKRFGKLTSLIADLENDDYGKWISPGSKDGVLQMPFVGYSESVHKFIEVMHDFADKYPKYNLHDYLGVLEAKGIKNIKTVNVSELDAESTLAVLMTIVRQDRFCEGLLLSCLEDGMVLSLLKKLKELDGEE